MKVGLRISRNRRVLGRACGHVSFLLKWPSGKVGGRDWYRKSLGSIIRMFEAELRRIPPAERSLATATFSAAVRKAGGGEKWARLASWAGSDSLESFYQAARMAWRELPKEDDGHRATFVEAQSYYVESRKQPSASR